jgi:hypothetical protein
MFDITIGEGRAVTEFVDEVIEEATGASSKKWAMVISALVVGAALAVWLSRRVRSGQSATTNPDLETT